MAPAPNLAVPGPFSGFVLFFFFLLWDFFQCLGHVLQSLLTHQMFTGTIFSFSIQVEESNYIQSSYFRRVK